MRRRTTTVIGAAVAASFLLASCGGGSTPDAQDTQGTSTEPAAGDAVDLTFWAWDPGMDKLVDAWNADHPEIQVKLENPAGGDELVTKMITAHKAGNGPDIGKIEYQSLPSLISAGAVVPIDDYIGDIDDAYPDNVWTLTRFDGQTYGLAQDFAPLMFYYRADIFDELGLTVPTTWDEYRQVAEQLRAARPDTYLGAFSSGDPGWFTGLVQQKGGNWWSYADSKWTVAIDDQATQDVTDYWQGLINDDLIAKGPFWTPEWSKSMDDGTIASWICGAWAAAQIGGIAPSGTGKWAMAPLPNWDGSDQTGIWGGSAMSVMADSKHPKEAAEFITWLNTDPAALALQISDIGVYPAATAGRSLPELATPPAFFPNQPDYYDVVSKAADVTRSFDVWGPNANVTFNAYKDGFASALQNGTPMVDALPEMQKTSVDDLTKLGINVAG
ncbi:sugar ABC transporter substrate-binding protein [Actinomycetota bacterium]|nr:sugar ABC transporter substrate-binding protein [Actinomycetota bacterium]